MIFYYFVVIHLICFYSQFFFYEILVCQMFLLKIKCIFLSLLILLTDITLNVFHYFLIFNIFSMFCSFLITYLFLKYILLQFFIFNDH